MDGKHVHIKAPSNSGSLFFNYKGSHSIVLLALVDSQYNFLFADVGCQGRISDGGVFGYSSLSEKLNNGSLNLPQPKPLLQDGNLVPFVIVADDAFVLSPNIVKPYPGQFAKSTPERKFNYRLSRARRVVENVFGMMSAKFRVFLTTLALEPEKAELVTLTCVYLHNFLRKSSARRIYFPAGAFDTEDLDTGVIVPGDWREEIRNAQNLLDLQILPRRSLSVAQHIRNEFREYVNSPEGSVPWQDLFA